VSTPRQPDWPHVLPLPASPTVNGPHIGSGGALQSPRSGGAVWDPSQSKSQLRVPSTVAHSFDPDMRTPQALLPSIEALRSKQRTPPPGQ